jgi:hypothetical protein
MTAGNQIGEHVGRAETRMHDALKQWDAADLPRCEECCELLRGAITEMEGAWRAAENGALASAGTRKRLYQLRADVGVMIQLVDASTAFCRGLALRIGAGNGDSAESPTALPLWSRSEA